MGAKICHRKAASNTGLVGITDTTGTPQGLRRITVSWRPAKGLRKCASFYYGGRSMSRDEALAKAIALRREKIAARAVAEGPLQ